jgi:hypothetical protein
MLMSLEQRSENLASEDEIFARRFNCSQVQIYMASAKEKKPTHCNDFGLKLLLSLERKRMKIRNVEMWQRQ